MLLEEPRFVLVTARLARQRGIAPGIELFEPAEERAGTNGWLLLRGDIFGELLQRADGFPAAEPERWPLAIRSLAEIEQGPDRVELRARLVFEVFGNRHARLSLLGDDSRGEERKSRSCEWRNGCGALLLPGELGLYVSGERTQQVFAWCHSVTHGRCGGYRSDLAGGGELRDPALGQPEQGGSFAERYTDLGDFARGHGCGSFGGRLIFSSPARSLRNSSASAEKSGALPQPATFSASAEKSGALPQPATFSASAEKSGALPAIARRTSSRTISGLDLPASFFVPRLPMRFRKSRFLCTPSSWHSRTHAVPLSSSC